MGETLKRLFQNEKFWFTILSLIAVSLSHSSFASGLIQVQNSFFKDSTGRVVLFRGVNVSNSSKIPPFLPLKDNQSLDLLQKFGMNLVRLTFIWEAFEPERGRYQFQYLERLGEFVEEAAKRGLYVMIDFHADAFSRYLLKGCGSGFPRWTIPDTLTPSLPDNGRACSKWGLDAILSDLRGGEIAIMSQAFYSNQNGMRTRFLLAWRQIARFFKKYPTLVGYDLFNEPWGDEISQIAPLYEDVAQVIRDEDPQAILFVEPAIYLLSALTTSDLPRPSFGNFAYAPHCYDITVLGTHAWNTGDLFIQSILSSILEQVQGWGVPVLIGEFGGPGDVEGIDAYMDMNYYLHDQNLLSDAQWDFNPDWTEENKDGWDMEDMSIVDSLGRIRPNFKVRPYARAVAGEPLKMKTHWARNPAQRSFVFDWYHRPELGKTEISIPARYFFESDTYRVKINRRGVTCLPDHVMRTLTCTAHTRGLISVQVTAPRH